MFDCTVFTSILVDLLLPPDLWSLCAQSAIVCADGLPVVYSVDPDHNNEKPLLVNFVICKMSINFYFLLIVSTFGIGFAYLDGYHCGAGPLSKTLSYMTSYSCGTDLSKFNIKLFRM